jgi:hypothetical protein
MVILRITPPVLTPGWTHDATDWQIAEDKEFKKIVAQSMGDKDNKIEKIFDLDLDPEKEYYARARVVFNKALSEWTDVNVIHPKDLTDLNLEIDIPGVISRPIVNVNYDPNGLPNSNFRITTSPMSTTSNAKHVSTTWVITDLEGRTVWMSPDDKDNLTSILVDEIVLEEGKTYIISAFHKASNNDVSEPGQITVRVPKVNDIEPVYDFLDRDKEKDLVVRLKPVDDVKKVNVKFFAVMYDEAKKLCECNPNKFTFAISKDLYVEDTDDYMLAITYTYKNNKVSGPKYFRVKLTKNS